MDLTEFRATLTAGAPQAGLGNPLSALWQVARGDWDAAHRLVQGNEGDPEHDWVHAHLHRVEGDLANAGHWYRSAGKPASGAALEAEWAEIASTLLSRRSGP